MYKRLKAKVSGLALLMALVFSFVIMVMLTSLLIRLRWGF